MSTTCALDFLTTFKTRRQHCRALLELSRQQLQLIAGDDFTELLDVLGQKQRLLGCLDELKHRHPQLWDRWQAQRDSLDAAVRHDCETALAESEGFLAEILENERGGTQALTARRDATQKQLQAISQGGQAHAAYRDGLAPATNRHLDVDQ